MRRLKKFFRGCLSSVFFVLYGLGSLAIGFGVLPVLVLFGSRVAHPMRMIIRATYVVFVWLADVAGLFRVSIAAEDLRKLKNTRGHVVVANHPSLIDIVILFSLLPESTGFAKAAAARNLFYSRVVKSTFIPNDNPAEALQEGINALKKGVNVIVFPQGTRTRQGETRKLHRGSANLSLRAGVPVLPVRIKMNFPVLGKGQPWYDVGDKTVEYKIEPDDVIYPDEEPSYGAAQRLTDKIGAAIN